MITIESRNDVRLKRPVRVLAFDESRGPFEADTYAIVVSATGSVIGIQQRVFPADVIRLVNLANVQEADFRVVGPSLISHSQVQEWGVECTDGSRNIWDIEFPQPDKNSPVVVECRACHLQESHAVTVLERELLASSGIIALNCGRCRQQTYWSFADPSLCQRRSPKLKASRRRPE